MIEYILLFSLGFLTAVLVAVLLAPAVRRRIVRFTENRIRATVPISTQELRAQTDMVRATYAAENAKLGVAVKREREKGLAHELTAEKLRAELKASASETASLVERLQGLEQDLAARQEELEASASALERARAEIQVKDDLLAEAEQRATELGIEAEHLGGFVDYGKIDLAVRETEIENLKSALSTLKSERDRLRDDLKAAEERARDAEYRLEQNDGRVASLKERIDTEVARHAEKDEALESRMRELERLKEKLAEITGSGAGAIAEEPPALEPLVEALATVAMPPEIDIAAEQPIEIDANRMTDGIRDDARAVADELSGSPDPARDTILREEIASIAARMVALTATKEGPKSPLLTILDGRKEAGHGRISLAARAARVLAGKDA